MVFTITWSIRQDFSLRFSSSFGSSYSCLPPLAPYHILEWPLHTGLRSHITKQNVRSTVIKVSLINLALSMLTLPLLIWYQERASSLSWYTVSYSPSHYSHGVGRPETILKWVDWKIWPTQTSRVTVLLLCNIQVVKFMSSITFSRHKMPASVYFLVELKLVSTFGLFAFLSSQVIFLFFHNFPWLTLSGTIKFLPLTFLSVSHSFPWENKNAVYCLQISAFDKLSLKNG